MPEVVAEHIDRLCTVEMRSHGNLPRGVTGILYQSARSARGGKPLTLLAAMALQERLAPGGRVFFVTGAGGPPHVPHGETDGPLGIVSLARALSLGLGITPVFVLEERHIPPTMAAAAAGGLSVAASPPGGTDHRMALLVPFPTGADNGQRAAGRLVSEHQPQAVVFVEKLGPNLQGVVHSVSGYPRDPNAIGAASFLADEARARGVLTIAVGDNGNEIGFGVIADVVRSVLPHGRRCRCPCASGIACVSEADVLVVSSISNWGAYGIAACLGYLMGDPELLHDEETERRMLEACVQAGGVDGALGRRELSVDGVPVNVQAAFVTMLRWIIISGLRTIERPF